MGRTYKTYNGRTYKTLIGYDSYISFLKFIQKNEIDFQNRYESFFKMYIFIKFNYANLKLQLIPQSTFLIL